MRADPKTCGLRPRLWLLAIYKSPDFALAAALRAFVLQREPARRLGINRKKIWRQYYISQCCDVSTTFSVPLLTNSLWARCWQLYLCEWKEQKNSLWGPQVSSHVPWQIRWLFAQYCFAWLSWGWQVNAVQNLIMINVNTMQALHFRSRHYECNSIWPNALIWPMVENIQWDIDQRPNN